MINLTPLQLLTKAYSTKKIVNEHSKQILFDKKNLISIYVQSGWYSKRTSRSYMLGSLWLYLECQRQNMSNYAARLKQYRLQQIQECDKQDLKDQFLNLYNNAQTQAKKEQAIQQSLKESESMKSLMKSQASQIKQQDMIGKQISRSQKVFDHGQIHRKYINNPLTQQKNVKRQSKVEYKQIIYKDKPRNNQQEFLGPFFQNRVFNVKKLDDSVVDTMKFVCQIQKPLINETKCLQLSRTYLSQYLDVRKNGLQNLSNKKNRFNMIIQKCKNPLIVVPHQNMNNGTLYLANFQKFATHAEYVEYALPSASMQRKYEFSHVLKGQNIIFQLVSFKQSQQNRQNRQNKDSKGQKDQKNVKQQKDSKEFRGIKPKDIRQNDRTLCDWSNVVGIVIQGRKEEYQFYDKLLNENIDAKNLKLMLISRNKHAERGMPNENTKYLNLDERLRYKDALAHRQLWRQIESYLFD